MKKATLSFSDFINEQENIKNITKINEDCKVIVKPATDEDWNKLEMWLDKSPMNVIVDDEAFYFDADDKDISKVIQDLQTQFTKAGISATFDPSKSTEDLEEILEGRKNVTIKRKYTDNYPAMKAGKYGPVREKILNFIREKQEDGGISYADLKEFISGMNEDIGSKTTPAWIYKNKKYIKTIKEGDSKKYVLSRWGNRILDRTIVNENNSINETKKRKIKPFNKVKVGDIAYENPIAGGKWNNALGEILWKGSGKELIKSKWKGLLSDLEYDSSDELDDYDWVVVDDEYHGEELYAYDDDPSSTVVFESFKDTKLYEAKKRKIKPFNKVKVGDTVYENPNVDGEWNNAFGEVVWKGSGEELLKSKWKKLLADVELDSSDEVYNLDWVVVDDITYGLELYTYNDDDPSSTVVFESLTEKKTLITEESYEDIISKISDKDLKKIIEHPNFKKHYNEYLDGDKKPTLKEREAAKKWAVQQVYSELKEDNIFESYNVPHRYTLFVSTVQNKVETNVTRNSAENFRDELLRDYKKIKDNNASTKYFLNNKSFLRSAGILNQDPEDLAKFLQDTYTKFNI